MSRITPRGYKRSRKATPKGAEVDIWETMEEGKATKLAQVEFPARLPWETASEYAKLCCFLFTPRPHSVRAAYRLWCQERGVEPKNDPPSSWYRAYRGEYAAFRRAKRQEEAIERAAAVHRRVPDWEGLEAAARKSGAIGQYDGEVGEIMDTLALIQWAFWSLAIDEKGDPIPGRPTWVERCLAYWEAAGAGLANKPQDTH